MTAHRTSEIGRVVVDATLLLVALWLAFLLRFDGRIPPWFIVVAAIATPSVLLTQLALLRLAKAERYSLDYMGLGDASRVVVALAVAAMVLLVVRFLVGVLWPSHPRLSYLIVPLGVLLIDMVVATSVILASRFGRRIGRELLRRPRASPGARALLIGAGPEGAALARALQDDPSIDLCPVGFLDDDPSTWRLRVLGIPILGPVAQVRHWADHYKATHALISLGTSAPAIIRDVHALCCDAGLIVRLIPGLNTILAQPNVAARLRDITLEDLLGRPKVHLDDRAIRSLIDDQVVMVTGAGGSIGSELCAQLTALKPKKLIVIDHSEANIFALKRSPSFDGDSSRAEFNLCDVTNIARMDALFEAHKPSVVLHAAAYKHVPLMESHERDAVRNNILATRALADLASKHRVDRFVMISTDKAVDPSSVMGATKRVAELYLQHLARSKQTKFITVRFGNVLGSSGSVVELFQKQIAAGGPVRVTHPQMERYFMSISEACQLVLEAAAIGEGGEVFILNMGDPINIESLARDLIRLSGLKPGADIAIEYSGVQPGEKLTERLWYSHERTEPTTHPSLSVARPARHESPDLMEAIRELEGLVSSGSPTLLRAALGRAVPEYRSRDESALEKNRAFSHS